MLYKHRTRPEIASFAQTRQCMAKVRHKVNCLPNCLPACYDLGYPLFFRFLFISIVTTIVLLQRTDHRSSISHQRISRNSLVGIRYRTPTTEIHCSVFSYRAASSKNHCTVFGYRSPIRKKMAPITDHEPNSDLTDPHP